ncbi:MAG: hypothetical protein KBA26_13275 [Candidatus Delongbacteria bacterium]|nr:hypothetical protein [Candidatus Delongbacteria bacterium]
MRILSIMFFLLLATSCARDYAIFYQSHIDGVANNLNKVSNDKFEFALYPTYNGIYFTIINLTDKSATLVWDKCYIVEPDGNSFKAANMDVFSEQRETLLKSSYESIIPPHSKLSRFTTASTNISMFSMDMVNVYKTFTSNRIQYEMISYDKTIPGYYWKPYITAKPNEILNTPFLFMMDNNNLGIGFHLIYDGQSLEYFFRIKVHSVEAYETNTNLEFGSPQVLKLKFTAIPDTWIWKSVEK